jgi:peroxiredoxin Q/BCP
MSDRASPLPDFELPATGNQRFQLSAFKGHPFVLYFYPKDNTPGCTVEGAQFHDLHDEFRKAKVAVFGISRDSVKSHEGFKAKVGFPFELLSDADEKACGIFGVMKMKNMYGRQVRGIERSAGL